MQVILSIAELQIKYNYVMGSCDEEFKVIWLEEEPTFIGRINGGCCIKKLESSIH